MEYRGYGISFRKNFRIADVRKIGSTLTAKCITRDKSSDAEWLTAEAKAFIDADLQEIADEPGTGPHPKGIRRSN